MVERLDDNCEQIGVYGFDKNGELIDFTAGSGPSKFSALIDEFAKEGIGTKLIEINKNKNNSSQAA